MLVIDLLHDGNLDPNNNNMVVLMSSPISISLDLSLEMDWLIPRV